LRARYPASKFAGSSRLSEIMEIEMLGLDTFLPAEMARLLFILLFIIMGALISALFFFKRNLFIIL